MENRFEYLVISIENTINVELDINKLGKQRWELVTIADGKAFLKRFKLSEYVDPKDQGGC